MRKLTAGNGGGRVSYISDHRPRKSRHSGRHAALPVMMADISAIEAVEISEIEHNLGELSSANLHIAKTLFDSNGFVAWQCLWSRDKRDGERETLNVLGVFQPKTISPT
jgi:hypothetical protein